MGCGSSSPTDGPDSTKGAVLVIGGTGKQGGAVARALLKDKKCKVVVASRNPDSDAAKEIAKCGATVVKVDLATDTAEDSPLLNACKEHNVDIAFLVTQFWEHCEADKEVAQGKRVIDVCKEVCVRHIVFSGFESGVDCPPVASKAEIEAYLVASEVNYTAVRVPLYMENFSGLMKPRKVEDGKYSVDLAMGDKKLAMISTDCMGECVAAIIRNPDPYKGKTIGLCGDCLTVKEICEKLTECIGGEFTDGELTTEKLSQMEFPGAPIFGKLFEFFQTEPERSAEETRKLFKNTKDLSAYLKANKDAIKAAIDVEAAA